MPQRAELGCRRRLVRGARASPYLGSSRRWIRATVVASLALALGLSIWPWVTPGDGRLRVIFLDVGQGDAILVELPEGQRLLVAAGPPANQAPTGGGVGSRLFCGIGRPNASTWSP